MLDCSKYLDGKMLGGVIMKTYKITVKHRGHKDMIRTGVDKLNSIIIPSELKLAYPKAFENGTLEVIVEEE